MILKNGIKYACELCIRGHRSTSCNHTNRPLVEIKKKGRPSTTCPHCKELRKSKNTNPSGTCRCAKLNNFNLNLATACNCQLGDICKCHSQRRGRNGGRSATSSAISTPMSTFSESFIDENDNDNGDDNYNDNDVLNKEIATLLRKPEQDLSYLFDKPVNAVPLQQQQQQQGGGGGGGDKISHNDDVNGFMEVGLDIPEESVLLDEDLLFQKYPF